MNFVALLLHGVSAFFVYGDIVGARLLVGIALALVLELVLVAIGLGVRFTTNLSLYLAVILGIILLQAIPITLILVLPLPAPGQYRFSTHPRLSLFRGQRSENFPGARQKLTGAGASLQPGLLYPCVVRYLLFILL